MIVPPPADVVVMELPGDPAAEARAAVESCRLVLGVEQCREASERGVVPAFHARVEWLSADFRQARVSVRRRGIDGPLVYVRQVEFSGDDTLEERYHALGLLIVSYVVAELSTRAADKPATVPTPPPPAPATPTPSVLGVGVDIGGQWSPGVTSQGSRLGAFVRPWLRSNDGSWRPFGRLGWIDHTESVDVDGYEGALGLALCFALGGPFSVEVNASAVAQHLRFRASDVTLGTDRASLTRYGGRFGVEGEWHFAQHVGVWAGVELASLSPGYALSLRNEFLGRDEGPKWGAVLGVRLAR